MTKLGRFVPTILGGALLVLFACSVPPRQVIVGEPKEPIWNSIQVKVLAPGRLELKSARFL